LKGFARNRAKKAQLYVVDAKARHAFMTTPLNVAAERDFNRIEIDGEDPNLIESSYADFEAKLAPALVAMDQINDFPDADARALILELVACFSLHALLLIKYVIKSRGHRASHNVEKCEWLTTTLIFRTARSARPTTSIPIA
jgi:hypothetical protein